MPEDLASLSNLRTIRLLRRLTQAQLAKLASLKQDYVSAMERGMRPSNRRHVERLAKALDISLDTLSGPPLVDLDALKAEMQKRMAEAQAAAKGGE